VSKYVISIASIVFSETALSYLQIKNTIYLS
jgi:hypothetical protein